MSRLEQVRGFLKRLDTELDTFVRPELGPDLNFSRVEYLISDVLNTAGRIRNGSVEQLPFVLLQKILEAISEISVHLKAIETFSVADVADRNENPVEVRKRLISSFETAASEFLIRVAPVLAFLAVENKDSVSNATAEAVREQLALAERSAGEAETLKRELDAIVVASREAAGKVGVSQHAAHFAEEAAKHAKESVVWLGVTVLAATATLYAAVYNYQVVVTTEVVDRGQVAQLIVAKLLLFSLLLTATVWCGRNYKSAKHNLVVNRHRQNALSSFQAFAEATSDEQTKNAVLLQATQSIFTPQPSGYVGAESETTGSAQIIELIRSGAAK